MAVHDLLLGVIHFTDTVTLGSIVVGVLLGLGGLATFGYGVRWKSNYEVERARADALEDGREAFRIQAERLHDELKTCMEDKAKLEASRSLEPILAAIGDGFQAMKEDLTRQLHVLSRIADELARLGVRNGHDDH